MGLQTDEMLGNVAPYPVIEALGELFDNPQWDRRESRRIPYFGPVDLFNEVDGVGVSAFARDISLSGIGLVHLAPLEIGEVTVELTLPSGRVCQLRTEICWCRSYGNGWYASGGKFLGVC